MKILVISQHLYPMQTPRAHRTTELVRELGKKGHDVTLYAVLGKHDYSDFEKQYHVKVKNIPLKWMLHPYNSDNDKKRTLIDKILGKLLKKLEFPNLEFMYRVPEILKKDHDYDALITIADPHQIHWGTTHFKKKYPHLFPPVWIADCGDPFMLNGSKSGHLKYFERYERQFCEACDYITVPVEQAKNGYYQEFQHKIEVIPQGFEFELPEKNAATTNSVLTFAYAGTFYKDIRNPEAFLKYLAELKMDFRFEVFSPHNVLIEQFKPILKDRLVIRETLKREDLINELRKMDFLVNIENVNSPAQVPSKLIDYAITGRPILSVNPVSPKKETILEFIKGDYSNQYVVHDIERYHISNVAEQFITLIKNNN
jgi:hypothetical protein